MPMNSFQLLSSLFKGPSNALGVDIGSYALKIIHLSGNYPRYKLSAWAHLPIEIGTSVEQDAAELRNTYTAKLQTFLAQNRQVSKDAVTGVDGPNVIVRTISIPRLAYTELSKTIQFEAEPFLPVSINDVELGFHIIGPSKDDAKKMDVLLAAVKKDYIESKISILNNADLRTVIVDCNSFALFNAYELMYEKPETAIIINIGASVTNMILVENKMLKIVRDLAYGGNEFTKSIQRSMTIDFNGAEKLKSSYGILVTSDEKEKTLAADKKDAIGVSMALSGSIKMLIGDIHRFIEFYLGQNPDAVINRILLTGGSSNLVNLATYISKETNISTEIFNPLIFVEGTDIIPKNIAPSMSVALGLAMRKEKDYLSSKSSKSEKKIAKTKK